MEDTKKTLKDLEAAILATPPNNPVPYPRKALSLVLRTHRVLQSLHVKDSPLGGEMQKEVEARTRDLEEYQVAALAAWFKVSEAELRADFKRIARRQQS